MCSQYGIQKTSYIYIYIYIKSFRLDIPNRNTDIMRLEGKHSIKCSLKETSAKFNDLENLEKKKKTWQNV